MMPLAREVDDRSRSNAVRRPFWNAGRNAQAPIKNNKCLAAPGGAVDHDEGLVLHPPLDQP